MQAVVEAPMTSTTFPKTSITLNTPN
jgi:hypothetical protein